MTFFIEWNKKTCYNETYIQEFPTISIPKFLVLLHLCLLVEVLHKAQQQNLGEVTRALGPMM